MKEIIYLIMSLIVVNIMLELFTNGTKLYNFSKFMFSTVIVFSVFVICINAIFNIEEEWMLTPTTESQMDTSYYEKQVENLENIIETRLLIEFDGEMSVKLFYHLSENQIDYDKVLVNKKGVDVLNEQITRVVNEYVDCEVEII